jgi:DNA-binding PadR family transcriptional regulator
MKRLRENGYLTVSERDYSIRDGRKANLHKLTPKGKRELSALRDCKVWCPQ